MRAKSVIAAMTLLSSVNFLRAADPTFNPNHAQQQEIKTFDLEQVLGELILLGELRKGFSFQAGMTAEEPVNFLRAADLTLNPNHAHEQAIKPFDLEQALGELTLLGELRKDFPFRAGMTVEEVQKLFDDNNRRVEALDDHEFARNEEAGTFGPPLFANRDLHLYIYVDDGMSVTDKSARRFWVNGRTQFWVAMAIEEGKVKNIYITPGNFSSVSPSLLFDGIGKDVGWAPEIRRQRFSDQ